MSTLNTVIIGSCVVGGLFVAAVALGGRAEDAANGAANSAMTKAGIVYGGKKAIDAGASRLGGGGGGGAPPIDLNSGKPKTEPSLPVAPPPTVAQPDGQDNDQQPQPEPERTMSTAPDCVIVVNIDGSTSCIALHGGAR